MRVRMRGMHCGSLARHAVSKHAGIDAPHHCLNQIVALFPLFFPFQGKKRGLAAFLPPPRLHRQLKPPYRHTFTAPSRPPVTSSRLGRSSHARAVTKDVCAVAAGTGPFPSRKGLVGSPPTAPSHSSRGVPRGAAKMARMGMLRCDAGERGDAAFALTEAMEVFAEKGLRSLSDVAAAALKRLLLWPQRKRVVRWTLAVLDGAQKARMFES